MNGNRLRGFPGGASGKEPACQCRSHERRGFDSLGGEDPVEKSMAIHSSILDWRIPWTEQPGGLQSTGWRRVRHDFIHHNDRMHNMRGAGKYQCLVNK